MDRFSNALTLYRIGKLADQEIGLEFFFHAYNESRPSKKLSQRLANPLPLNYEELSHFQFKGVKTKALEAMRAWKFGTWPFVLIEHLPTSLEILEAQAAGKRPLSMITTDLLSPIFHRKNAFDFFCHDLEHGAMFFSDPELYQRQVEMFKNLLKLVKAGQFNDLLRDSEKRKKLTYLLSDMNTCPEHAKAYLNSLLPLPEQGNFDYAFFV
jgi:hypothetical protein